MDNLWSKINDELPNYFKEISEKYSLKILHVNKIKTVLIGKGYALLISIDRFSADVDYIRRNENNELVVYECNNYFSQKYDDSDRINLIDGNTAKEIIINDLIIISKGLQSKWEKVLKGDIKWISDFEKSKWFGKRKLNNDEKAVLENYI